MEAKAILRSARISAQKARLVADQVRGLSAERAVNLLKFSDKKAAHLIKKVVESAIANAEHQNVTVGKAGRSRHKGKRPQSRGIAMNPVDHPHGGGEAKAGQGNPHPVTPWGVPTKGYKTRKNKRTQQFIVRDRRS